MPNDLVKVEYQAAVILFNEDGWFNATSAAGNFGKRPVDWLALESTKEYLEALDEVIRNQDSRFLSEDLRSEKSSLLKVKRGGRGKSDSTWMHPDLAVAFARWLDIRFSIWCDHQIKLILTRDHPHYDQKKLRHQAAASYKVVGQILQLTRERLGKATAPHHYSNEARLINHALTGIFGKVDRDGLCTGDLDLLAKLENLDTVLIGCGMDYEVRKTELEQFAQDQRVMAVPAIQIGEAS